MAFLFVADFLLYTPDDRRGFLQIITWTLFHIISHFPLFQATPKLNKTETDVECGSCLKNKISPGKRESMHCKAFSKIMKIVSLDYVFVLLMIAYSLKVQWSCKWNVSLKNSFFYFILFAFSRFPTR